MSSPFAIVPVEVFQDDRLTKIELRVLGAILTFRNRDTNLSRPTRAQIGERCGYEITTVSRATTGLVNKGWLEKVGKGGAGMATVYRLTVPEPETVSEPETVPESGTKRCPVRAENGVRTGHTNLPITDHIPTNNDQTLFDRFWKGYPRKVGKPNAIKAWKRIKDPDQVMEGLAAWVAHWKTEETDQRFIPHPSTWLNDERYATPPAAVDALPSDDSKLETWARRHGMRGPRRGETYREYREALRNA